MPKGHGDGSKATQFQPGNTANPGGRPKGFATKIKELCGDDYEQIAEGLYTIARGKPAEIEAFFGCDIGKVTAKDRIAAFVALRDSGPGRPVQALEHRGDVPAATRIVHEFADEEPADEAARETA
jgi:hypothetical protein